MIVVMNCVNLRSMNSVKWLNSPRWMGHRSCKVRPGELLPLKERGGKQKKQESVHILTKRDTLPPAPGVVTF